MHTADSNCVRRDVDKVQVSPSAATGVGRDLLLGTAGVSGDETTHTHTGNEAHRSAGAWKQDCTG